MELLLAVVLLLLAFAALGWPLYAARPRIAFGWNSARGDLLAQRDGLYATLRDLDQDYALGKLGEGDYHARRERYLARATMVLKQLDQDDAPLDSPDDDAIEVEIRALRSSASPAGAATRDGQRDSCPNCGRARNADDRFCGNCGRALS